jgi:hypothetical protein
MKMQNIPVAPVKRLRTALEARRPPNSTRLAIEVGGVSYLDLNPPWPVVNCVTALIITAPSLRQDQGLSSGDLRSLPCVCNGDTRS